MFKELSGQTLTKDQLIDWSIVKGISLLTVEDIIYLALDARANITNLSKKYLEGMGKKMQERKITKERLLALCKDFGTDKVAEGIIAETTGCTMLTIRTYIQKWGIKGMLSKMAATDLENMKETLKDVKGMDEPLKEVEPLSEREALFANEVINGGEPDVDPVADFHYKLVGGLIPVSLKGENHAYTICEADKTAIVSDLQTKSEIEIPFDEFETFAAELNNFNANYLRRFLS